MSFRHHFTSLTPAHGHGHRHHRPEQQRRGNFGGNGDTSHAVVQDTSHGDDNWGGRRGQGGGFGGRGR
jgi:hypothetical protein